MMSYIDRGNYICTGLHGQLGLQIPLQHANWTSYQSNVSMNKNLDGDFRCLRSNPT